MTDAKVLEAIPDVAIDLPLPTGLPEGRVAMAFASPWQNAEREFVLGIMTTAAIRKGGWCVVDTETFAEILQQGPWKIMRQGVINATWSLFYEGYLEIVHVEDSDYIVPNRKLALALNACQLRWA